jgi:hypothetical protein
MLWGCAQWLIGATHGFNPGKVLNCGGHLLLPLLRMKVRHMLPLLQVLLFLLPLLLLLQVRSVVLRINSPGGSAVASDMIAREIKLLREAGKPVRSRCC